MLPTRTTVLLLTAGLLLWLIGLAALALHAVLPSWLTHAIDFTALWIVLGYDGCVVLLFFADAVYALRAPRFGRLSVRRERPARLSLGVDNEILLVLENHSSVRLTLIVRDQIPSGFRADPIQLSGVVPAHGQGRLPYRLLPTQRGDFSFGDVSIRCRGPLGLAFVDRRLPAGEAVQVYPNLLEVRRYEAMLRTTLVRAGGYRPNRTARRRPGVQPLPRLHARRRFPSRQLEGHRTTQ